MDDGVLLIHIRQYFGIYYEWNIFKSKDGKMAKHLISGNHNCKSEAEAIDEANELIHFIITAPREVKTIVDDMKLPSFVK